MLFSLSRNDISPALSRMAEAARNKPPVLRAMGTTFKSLTEGTFNSVGAGYRPRPWPAKVDGTQSILQSRNPTMSKSFHLTVTAENATLSNPMPYAAIHQFGGKTAAHKITPKRGKALAFKKGGADVVVASVNHPGSNIPARPFYPVVDGHLTPKAEVKIAAAGERELVKQFQ